MTDKKRCESCGTSKPSLQVGAFSLFDYCAVCLRDLCDACMKKGCCGHVPAKSGQEEEGET